MEDFVVYFFFLGDVIIGGDFNVSIYDGDVYYVNVYKLRLFKDFVMCNYLGCFCVDFDIFGLDYIFILI